jgi:hypothetical protein
MTKKVTDTKKEGKRNIQEEETQTRIQIPKCDKWSEEE